MVSPSPYRYRYLRIVSYRLSERELTHTTARSPCPMLNTLANHGYLPRGGRSISQEDWTHALVTALNFDPQVAKGLFGNAILSNTSKGAEEFDLYAILPAATTTIY